MKVCEKVDPEIRKRVENLRSFSLTDGALPAKTKILMAMAIDPSHGSTQGVKALAQPAMKGGATKAESGEALRVALYVSGVGSAFTAARALKELL